MAKSLVVVESPAKAKTIAGYLGSGFVVEACMGNVRDLPSGADEIPATHKDKPWARLGVDTEGNFEPLYVIPPSKRSHVTRLKTALKNADALYLATDEDREGESISWHLLQLLKPKVPVMRMVFHEISKSAIKESIANPREIDNRLVEAQETRRILDRLFGYEVSPVLWKKVASGLSAGRVQSVFVRVIVEREWERMRFVSADWWDIEATLASGNSKFPAKLWSVDAKRVATGKDFDSLGQPKGDAPKSDTPKSDSVVLDEAKAVELARQLKDATFTVESIDTKPYRSSPRPPFTTSTLQQEAGRKLRFAAQHTMRVAQGLYEAGYITYMRTDSVALSETALAAVRDQIKNLYGADFLPSGPRNYTSKTRNAQEAHEAIRPGGDVMRTPEQISKEVSSDEARLYELIWKRTMASQMPDASGSSVSVKIAAANSVFSASGRTIDFPGYLRAYVEGSDDPDAELADRETILPPLTEGQGVDCQELTPLGHTTQPPARYTEASLIQKVDELGVGRPSTLASMIATIQARGYVFKRGSALIPSWTAFAIVNLLEQHFPDLVDYSFTARMEEILDEIASGKEQARPWLAKFYFGNGAVGLKAMVDSEGLGKIDAREVCTIPISADIVVRVGKWGPYLQRGDEIANIPEALAPDELTATKAEELLAEPKGDKILGTDVESGLTVLVRVGRFGPYVQLGEDDDSKDKPKRSSLFKSQSVDSMTLDDAVALLSIPRLVGLDAASSEEIWAHNGKFGPYLKRGTDTRSLSTEESILAISLDEALALFAQPRSSRRAAAAQPIRVVGEDPVSKAEVTVKEGRFGPYVTDGTVNASLRKGDEPESITLERAAELLQYRRDNPPTKRAAKKSPAKKKTAKKSSAKKAPKRKA